MIDKEDIKLFSLGELYISDFIEESNEPKKGKAELSLFLEHSTGAARLGSIVDPDLM